MAKKQKTTESSSSGTKVSAKLNPTKDIRLKISEAKAAASSSSSSFQPKDENAGERALRELENAQLPKLNDLEKQLSEKFPDVDTDAWFTLPSKHGNKPWVTKAACGAVRHPNSGNSWQDKLRVSPTMRMKWREFLDDWTAKLRFSRMNTDDRNPEDRYKDLRPDNDHCIRHALLYLMNQGGGKPRFRILWPEGFRELMKSLGLQFGSVEFWKHCPDPLEIQCVQGGSGDRDIDERNTYRVPHSILRFFHAGYLKDLRSMLMYGGVFAGGTLGFKHRGRIYFSCADWLRYARNYTAPQIPFTGFRQEPYPVRGDWSMQVVLCHESCRDADGHFVQTETLAGVGPLNWNAPANCIEQINSRDGCVLFRRHDPLQNAFWAQAERKLTRDDYEQRHPKCYHCGASYPRGLVYCFECGGIVQGAKEENIFHRRGESQRVRGDDSEIAKIKKEVILKIRRVDDLATNPRQRGARQHRRQHPTDVFSAYCAKQYKRCIMAKGCPDLDGNTFYYVDTRMCLRERCIQDPNFFGQLEAAVRDKHLHLLEDGPFDFVFVDYMCDVGRWRRDNPVYNPMGFYDRVAFNAGKTELHTEGTDASSTPAVSSYSDYQAMRATAPPAISEKGKGKAKGKGKDKGKDKKRQRQGW